MNCPCELRTAKNGADLKHPQFKAHGVKELLVKGAIHGDGRYKSCIGGVLDQMHSPPT
jgi:hypothetical protein